MGVGAPDRRHRRCRRSGRARTDRPAAVDGDHAHDRARDRRARRPADRLPAAHDRRVGGAHRRAAARDAPRRRSVERVDRHARPSPRISGVAHVSRALSSPGYACTTRAATRLVLPRVDARARSCSASGATAELLGHAPLGLTFADSRAGGPFGQPAYLGAACLLLGPLGSRGRARRGASARGGGGPAPSGRSVRHGRARGVTDARGVGRRRSSRPSRSRSQQRRVLRRSPRMAAGRHRRRRRDRVRRRRDHAARRAGASSTFDLHRRDEREPVRRVADRDANDRRPSAARRRARGLPRRVPAGGRRGVRARIRRGRVSPTARTTASSTSRSPAACSPACSTQRCSRWWSGARVARRCARAIRSPIALGAAVIAYVVQQQFLFPLAELDPIFWVLVGHARGAQRSGDATR